MVSLGSGPEAFGLRGRGGIRRPRRPRAGTGRTAEESRPAATGALVGVHPPAGAGLGRRGRLGLHRRSRPALRPLSRRPAPSRGPGRRSAGKPGRPRRLAQHRASERVVRPPRSPPQSGPGAWRRRPAPGQFLRAIVAGSPGGGHGGAGPAGRPGRASSALYRRDTPAGLRQLADGAVHVDRRIGQAAGVAGTSRIAGHASALARADLPRNACWRWIGRGHGTAVSAPVGAFRGRLGARLLPQRAAWQAGPGVSLL